MAQKVPPLTTAHQGALWFLGSSKQGCPDTDGNQLHSHLCFRVIESMSEFCCGELDLLLTLLLPISVRSVFSLQPCNHLFFTAGMVAFMQEAWRCSAWRLLSLASSGADACLCQRRSEASKPRSLW
jgi:hypothetical protein